jgi:hypothetical protein
VADRANVTSVEALESFRASLLVYIDKVGITLDEIDDAVKRMRVWVQTEQPEFWRREIKRLTRALEDAEQALFSSRLSASREPSAQERMNVNRLRRELRRADEKLKITKKWARNYDSIVEPLAKKLEVVRFMTTQRLPQGTEYLRQAANTLHSYAETSVAAQAAANRPAPISDSPGGDGEKESISEDSEKG